MEDELARALRDRKDVIAQIIRASREKPIADIAEEILKALDGNAVLGFTFTRPNGALILHGMRETRDAVRLAGAEGHPTSVLLVPLRTAEEGVDCWRRTGLSTGSTSGGTENSDS
jgi:hypothetical protein